jgi:hypothetical protein
MRHSDRPVPVTQGEQDAPSGHRDNTPTAHSGEADQRSRKTEKMGQHNKKDNRSMLPTTTG